MICRKQATADGVEYSISVHDEHYADDISDTFNGFLDGLEEMLQGQGFHHDFRSDDEGALRVDTTVYRTGDGTITEILRRDTYDLYAGESFKVIITPRQPYIEQLLEAIGAEHSTVFKG